MFAWKLFQSLKWAMQNVTLTQKGNESVKFVHSWTVIAVMDGHGRSWTLMDAGWTLGGRDGHVGWTRRSRWWTLCGRDGHAEWTRRSRWVDATVTVTLPNHKNHCKNNLEYSGAKKQILNIFCLEISLTRRSRWVDAKVTLSGREGHAEWTRRSRWVDAKVTLSGRDGHSHASES